MEDTCAMALLWKKAFTMTCSWMKGKCLQLFTMTFLQSCRNWLFSVIALKVAEVI